MIERMGDFILFLWFVIGSVILSVIFWCEAKKFMKKLKEAR
jgi:hypothetical protein